MAEQLTRERIAQDAIIHQQIPALVPHEVDRSFELPTALYAITVGLFLAFIGLMAFGFAHPEMILPTAIFAIFVVAGFGVPAIWTRLAPVATKKAKCWNCFSRDGVMTYTGPTTARDATVQVLILPVLIFLWGVCVVTIAALV